MGQESTGLTITHIIIIYLRRVTRQDREHVPLMSSKQAGVDWMGSATPANKNMRSEHRTADMAGTTHGQRK